MQLPSLAAVRVFEAAARHLSVSRAAEELHVTAGAVSQQVRKLEDFLGHQLFERLPRGLALTAQGQDYYAACREAIAIIGRATNKLTVNERRQIVVSCTPSIAIQWLVPRLQQFLQTSPQVDVQVSASNRVVDLKTERVDFAIRHGLGRDAGLACETLIDDDLVPVCSPSLVAPRKSVAVKDITGTRLLHDEHRGDWRLWIEAAGLQGVDADAGIVFVDSNAAIEAALAGHGFALVRRGLVAGEIARHRLLALKATPLKTQLAYRLVYLREALVEPELRRFRDWLISQRSS